MHDDPIQGILFNSPQQVNLRPRGRTKIKVNTKASKPHIISWKGLAGMRFFDIKYQAGEGLQRQPRANLAAAVIGGVLAINAVAFGITGISNDHHYKVHNADNKTITLNRSEASPSKTNNNGGNASSPAGDNSGPASATGTNSASGETAAAIQGSSPPSPTSGGGSQPAIVGGRGGGSTSGGSSSGTGSSPPPCICQTITGLADPALQTITQTTTALP